MKLTRLVICALAILLCASGLRAQQGTRSRQPWGPVSTSALPGDDSDPLSRLVRNPPLVSPGASSRPGGVISVSQLRVPDKAMKEFGRAQKAFHAGDLRSSAAHLQKAIEIYPRFFGAHIALGLRYVQFGQYEKALDEHQSALALDSRSVEAHENLTLDLLLLNRNAEAESEAREALKLAPEAPGARYFLARAIIAQRRATPEALQLLKETQKAFPDASLVLAQLDYDNASTGDAVTDLRQYLTAPSDADNKHKAECWLARLTGQPEVAACSDVPARPSFK